MDADSVIDSVYGDCGRFEVSNRELEQYKTVPSIEEYASAKLAPLDELAHVFSSGGAQPTEVRVVGVYEGHFETYTKHKEWEFVQRKFWTHPKHSKDRLGFRPLAHVMTEKDGPVFLAFVVMPSPELVRHFQVLLHLAHVKMDGKRSKVVPSDVTIHGLYHADSSRACVTHLLKDVVLCALRDALRTRPSVFVVGDVSHSRKVLEDVYRYTTTSIELNKVACVHVMARRDELQTQAAMAIPLIILLEVKFSFWGETATHVMNVLLTAMHNLEGLEVPSAVLHVAKIGQLVVGIEAEFDELFIPWSFLPQPSEGEAWFGKELRSFLPRTTDGISGSHMSVASIAYENVNDMRKTLHRGIVSVDDEGYHLARGCYDAPGPTSFGAVYFASDHVQVQAGVARGGLHLLSGSADKREHREKMMKKAWRYILGHDVLPLSVLPRDAKNAMSKVQIVHVRDMSEGSSTVDVRFLRKVPPGAPGVDADGFVVERNYQAEVVDPFLLPAADIPTKKELAWYFEEYATHPFNLEARAKKVAKFIRWYGESLFAQVFGEHNSNSPAARLLHQAVDMRTLTVVEICGDSAFQRHQWEAMWCPDEKNEALCMKVPFIRHSTIPSSSTSGDKGNIGKRSGSVPHVRQIPQSETLNVLLVTARPRGATDIAYRLLAKPLVEQCWKKRDKLSIDIDIVRPGTLERLKKHLAESRKRAKFYHIFHFDGHGAVLTYLELAAGVLADQFAVQFSKDVSKTKDSLLVTMANIADIDKYDGNKPFLFFETTDVENDNTKKLCAHAVAVDEISPLLQQYQIPVVFLDACQSSKEGGVHPSFASSLLGNGVRVVVGMSYSVNVDGALQMMMGTYEAMLQREDDSTVGRALVAGRRAMFEKKARRARFGETVELDDWILPVVYSNGDVSLDIVKESDASRNAWKRRKAERYKPSRPPLYGFHGRDADVLRIERRVLDEPLHNILLIRGMGGAGKSTLMEHLGTWWQQTHLVDRVFYFGYDDAAHTVAQIVHNIARDLLPEAEFKSVFTPISTRGQATMVSDLLRETRHLLILDNLETITEPFYAVKNTTPLSSDDQEDLRLFLHELVGGRSLVLLGSRAPEDWLCRGVCEQNMIHLGGLDTLAASEFAHVVLTKNRANHVRGNPDCKKLLAQVLARCDHYPLVMAIVLGGLTASSRIEDVQRICANFDDGTIDFTSKGNNPDKSKDVMLAVQYGFATLDGDLQGLLECLTPFRGVFTVGLGEGTVVLDMYTEELRKVPETADLTFSKWEDALTIMQTRGLMTLEGSVPGVYKMQPVLPYFLRDRLAGTGRTSRRNAINTAFYRHMNNWGGSVARHMNDESDPQIYQVARYLAQVELENCKAGVFMAASSHDEFLGALEMCCTHMRAHNQLASVLAIYREVLQRDAAQEGDGRSDVGTHGVRILVLGELGIAQLDLKLYEDASSSFLAVLPLAEAAALRDPTFARAVGCTHHSLGLIAMEQRQFEKAEQHYRKAIETLRHSDLRTAGATYNNLGMVAQEQNHFEEALQHYGKALEIKLEFNDMRSAAGTYERFGSLAADQRQYALAEQHYVKALDIYEQFGDKYSAAGTQHSLGIVAKEQRQFSQAEWYYRTALEVYVQFGDLRKQGSTYHGLGVVATEQGQLEQAEHHNKKALEIFLQFNDQHAAARTYHSLGVLATTRGQFAQATQLLNNSLGIKLQLNDMLSVADTYLVLGNLKHCQGQIVQAEQHYRDALEIQGPFKNKHCTGLTYHNLGMVAQEQHHFEAALQHYGKALEIKLSFNDMYSAAGTLECLGSLAEEQGQFALAEQRYDMSLEVYAQFNDMYDSPIVHRLQARLEAVKGRCTVPTDGQGSNSREELHRMSIRPLKKLIAAQGGTTSTASADATASDGTKSCTNPNCKSRAVGIKLMRCTGCRAVWYCSVVCQRAHWKAHKSECKGKAPHPSALASSDASTAHSLPDESNKACANPRCDTDALHAKLMRCTGCHAVWYCSVGCQRAHRKAHKPMCKPPV